MLGASFLRTPRERFLQHAAAVLPLSFFFTVHDPFHPFFSKVERVPSVAEFGVASSSINSTVQISPSRGTAK